MIEYSIIHSFLKDRKSWEKYYGTLNVPFLKDNLRELYKVLRAVDWYYRKYPASVSMSIHDLEAVYINSYPVLKDVERQELKKLLGLIEQAEANGVTSDYLETHRVRAVANELAMVAFDVAEGRRDRDSIEAVYSKFGSVAVHSNDYVNDDLEVLYGEQRQQRGLRWRLGFLNRSIGSLRAGDFGFVFARPETGKTTFLASETTAFAGQTVRPILWCNNEEGGAKVMLRCYQAALGWTNQQLFENRDKAKELYTKLTGNRIKIYDDAGMTMRSIEERCKELNPSLIIMDQIDKIRGFKDDRYDLQMKFLYQWARERAKEYGPVIATCQAGGTAEGKRWLTMNDVDSSHTAKQGEADWILGIGKSNEEGMSALRFMNISKNKLLGDEDTVPELRHGRKEVKIEPEVARYSDL